MSKVACLVALAALAVGSVGPQASRAVTYVYLTVSLSGSGSGAWTSSDGQIDCHMVNGVVGEQEPCSGQYVLGDTVNYSILPATGSCYWSHGCKTSGSGSLTLTQELTTAYALFTLLSYPLTVTRSGAGTGSVGSTPVGIACGATCSAAFDYGTGVTLTATADQGAYFAGWTGACAGQDQSCALTITAATSTNAVFGFGTPPTPSPSPGGNATPTATAAPTPRASTKPGTTAIPGPTSATAPPEASDAPSSSVETPAVPSTDLPAATNLPGASASAAPIASPDASPAGGSGDGSLALAILGAGLFIALAIGGVGFAALRRRPGAPPPTA